ncbi:RNA-directed DNA polymerase (Reverse transcriptase), Ribonuclease H [Gossypium australe]|uniref:RNA-directed DNA polymerase (Reverse transcriptase), Ribonuclease H n=1 Tax=Gossypium australe TaxID=47621 RepID=A0A5B6WAZ0_9ROSI|nr:RNA-directed DNA polymerase (Reverse transcriptase), Ribonuclease H [Gossypium australe]
MRPDVLLKVKEEVRKQFDAGFLQMVKYSEWVANIVPVPKKDGKVRMCVDYRDLNKASPKDNFPLPHIDTLVDNTAGYSLFSFMDGFSGYNQIKMHPEDMEKTTFITMWGTFCYKVMPFGLKNAGATYQRAMVTLFHDMMHKEIEVYVDDMIAKSRTEREHVQVLRKLFLRLRKFQLKLNPTKCTFGARSGKLLGFVVSKKGIEVDPDKVKAIQELPPPRTQKEVRSFLGRLNYIARFIAQLTEKCDPIFRLLRKHNSVVWNEECQKAFDKVKHYLSKAPVLVSPCPNKPLILYLSVFENSMGCVLGQHDESGRKERAIYYLSKKFTECETRYSPIEKLCCALVWTTRRLRQYMLYHTTWLISKLDPLKFMMESTALNGRMARWQILLSEFDIIYVNQKAIKGSAIADFLASRALEDYEPLDFDFPNEELMYVAATEEEVQKKGHPWKLNFDGASNAMGNGIGAVLVSPNGDHYPLTSKLDFDCTNNMAEYEACILGIRAAIERKIGTLEVYGDSALVIYQLKGEWETRDPKLISYRRLVLELIKEFDNVTFCYLPREENQMADALATLASMIKVNKAEEVKPIQMSIYEAPAHCCNIDEEEERDSHPWYHDVLRYVKDREYPDQATENDKRTLRRLANDYVLDGEILYKRRKDQVLLRCVDAVEAKKILEEVHEGVCGTHANGFTMARQIMRFGYYWSTMEGDCISYAKRCHKCQIYGDKIHVPPSPLHVMTSPWPFSIWGMDVIGPISPKAANGHRFIFVVIDYFTKWVEATSYANVTKSAVSKFLKKEIICRYGMPERIISDNALNLNNSTIAEVCSQFKIQHHNSSPYRPKMNGAVEAANKNIKKIMGKMTETYKDWHEKLPFALYAYRTSVRTSTGATPFSLVYGMEAVLPIEVEIPSLRVLAEIKLDEAEWTQSRYDQLNLIEEKRLKALRHGQMYQRRMIRAYNKKVHPREFYEGDLVLKKILPIQKDFRGKWMPNWEGPYVVKKAFSGGALILTEMDGKSLPNPVNSDSVWALTEACGGRRCEHVGTVLMAEWVAVVEAYVRCTRGRDDARGWRACFHARGARVREG